MREFVLSSLSLVETYLRLILGNDWLNAKDKKDKGLLLLDEIFSIWRSSTSIFWATDVKYF